ncbi:MAG: hypothetical protein HKM06_04780 [Spirochaetales bacterium]|nr:hypothetical protein [Spirochaetales bacterium]
MKKVIISLVSLSFLCFSCAQSTTSPTVLTQSTGGGTANAPTATPTVTSTPTLVPISSGTPPPIPVNTSLPVPTPSSPTPAGAFPVAFVNNTHGAYADNQIYIFMVGMDAKGEWCWVTKDGVMTPINGTDANAPGHLSYNGVNYPNYSFTVADAGAINVPTFITGGRIYISLGSPLYIPVSGSGSSNGWVAPNPVSPTDPNYNTVFDWYEFTYVNVAANPSVAATYPNGVHFGGNTTQVDMFGLPMSVRLIQKETSYDQSVGIDTTEWTRAQIFAAYEGFVNPAFLSLVLPNKARIVAPGKALASGLSGSYSTYLDSTISAAWSYYQTHTLNLTGGAVGGQIYTGSVDPVSQKFTFYYYAYSGATKQGPFYISLPSTEDVFAGNGNLATIDPATQADGSSPPDGWIELALEAQFCAALNRGVFTNGSEWSTPDLYYPSSTPHNDYAEFWHTLSGSGLAYGFCYDDVNAQSSVQILPNDDPPDNVIVTIGD